MSCVLDFCDASAQVLKDGQPTRAASQAIGVAPLLPGNTGMVSGQPVVSPPPPPHPRANIDLSRLTCCSQTGCFCAAAGPSRSLKQGKQFVRNKACARCVEMTIALSV